MDDQLLNNDDNKGAYTYKVKNLLLPFAILVLHVPAQGAHGDKYQLLQLYITLAKQWLLHGSVDRIALVPKEPMARRLTVNEVIESDLDSSFDGESEIEKDPSFLYPSASRTQTTRHARLHANVSSHALHLYQFHVPSTIHFSLPQAHQTQFRIRAKSSSSTP